MIHKTAFSQAPVRAAYSWVDTATHGAFHRNHIMPRADYNPNRGATDCYITWMRFSKELVDYAAANPSPSTGKPPSVAGYPGPAWAEFFPIDFDCRDCPAEALSDAA